MTNCKYLQILVTNLDGTTTLHTFQHKHPHINCIINSSHKYLDITGQLLDASKLTNIKEHSGHDVLGTHMYVADEDSCRSYLSKARCTSSPEGKGKCEWTDLCGCLPIPIDYCPPYMVPTNYEKGSGQFADSTCDGVINDGGVEITYWEWLQKGGCAASIQPGPNIKPECGDRCNSAFCNNDACSTYYSQSKSGNKFSCMPNPDYTNNNNSSLCINKPTVCKNL